MSKRIEDTRLAVEAMYKCAAKHESSVLVIEMFGTNEIWEGVVEVFALTGHSNAKRCYVWNFADEGARPDYMAVLELPPVFSPHTAVRAAIASGQKKRRPQSSKRTEKTTKPRTFRL
jgi:hypothetical protein